MSSQPSLSPATRAEAVALAQVQALRRIALAVAHPGGPEFFADIVLELASSLHAGLVFVAVFADASRSMMRTLAACLDGRMLRNFEYPLRGSPCANVVGRSFQYIASGVCPQLPPGSLSGGKGMDSFAAFPLNSSTGEPLGLVVAMDRQQIAAGDADHAEAMLKIVAGRAAAEIDRERKDQEQQRAVEALRLSEEQYRAIFEGSLDGLFLWDEQFRVADVNPAGLALYGFRREEVIGRSFSKNLPQDYVQDRLALLRRALAGETLHMETTLLRPDGTSFDVDVRLMPFVQRGRPHALSVVRDITERVRADRALRASEEQYRAIFNASLHALVLRAADFSIVDVNATYEAMSGYSRAEVLGVNRVLANPPEMMPTIRALHDRALAGEAISLDTQLIRRDGHRYELELRGVPIQHRGQPHVLYIGRDITKAKSVERALRDSEEQYRAIFNASADALVLRDAEFRAVEVNPAYLMASGYTRDEVLAADHVLTQLNVAERAGHRADHEQALAGRELRFEITATRKNGSTFQAEVRGTPMLYRGRPHVLYAVRDVTERKAAEQRRGELERQLRQAQKMEAIGQLTGGIAHDFNNILTTVLGYIAMAQERPTAAEDAVLMRQLGQAQLAAERAREHVAQLLAFSRPRRGERHLLAPDAVARQALQLMRPNLPSSITLECTAGCDEDDETSTPVLADPVQLEQVLFNLCINARDAIGGHGTIRVRTGHSPAAGHCASCSAQLEGTPWVWFEVEDDGSGMPQEVIERMFEPFFTTKEVGRGTGMGLAMVHGIVHDHGGHVSVVSTPGQGSTFRVLLPPAAHDAGPADAPAAAPQSTRKAPPLEGRVLLVEDAAIVSEYMVDLLTGWGLEVVLEPDPVAAAHRLDCCGGDFDLLLTDQTMPGMTGMALARHAKQRHPALPVLLYTGNASEIREEELRECGVDALLRKPIEGAALRGLLRELLRSEYKKAAC